MISIVLYFVWNLMLLFVAGTDCGADEARIKIDITSASSNIDSSFDVILFDSSKNELNSADNIGGSTSASIDNFCVSNNDCYFIVLNGARVDVNVVIAEINNDGSESELANKDIIDRSSSGVDPDVFFCPLGYNYIAPIDVDSDDNSCPYNYGKVTIDVLAQNYPEEAGWYIKDIDNNNKIVFYEDNLVSRTLVESREGCLLCGNYELVMYNTHRHGINGYHELSVNDIQVIYESSGSISSGWSSIEYYSFIIDCSCPDECSDSPCSEEESEGPDGNGCQVYNQGSGCSQCNINDGYFKKDENYPCLQCQTIFGEECLHCADEKGCQQCTTNTFDLTYDETCGLYKCVANPCYFEDNYCRVCNNGYCSQCESGYVRLTDDATKCEHCQNFFGSNCRHCADKRGCQQCNDNSQPQEIDGFYYCFGDEEHEV